MTIHCPKCGVEIDHLHLYERHEIQYDFYSEDEVDQRNDSVLDEEPVDFECPECNELLFHDEEQANKFMQWGDLYPWKGVDDYGQKPGDPLGEQGKG